MPIDIDEFEHASEEDLEIDRSPYEDDPVVEFLAYNPEEAYTMRELQANTGLPLLELASRLSTLVGQGIVRHRGSYWAIDPEYVDRE